MATTGFSVDILVNYQNAVAALKAFSKGVVDARGKVTDFDAMIKENYPNILKEAEAVLKLEKGNKQLIQVINRLIREKKTSDRIAAKEEKNISKLSTKYSHQKKVLQTFTAQIHSLIEAKNKLLISDDNYNRNMQLAQELFKRNGKTHQQHRRELLATAKASRKVKEEWSESAKAAGNIRDSVRKLNKEYGLIVASEKEQHRVLELKNKRLGKTTAQFQVSANAARQYYRRLQLLNEQIKRNGVTHKENLKIRQKELSVVKKVTQSLTIETSQNAKIEAGIKKANLARNANVKALMKAEGVTKKYNLSLESHNLLNLKYRVAVAKVTEEINRGNKSHAQHRRSQRDTIKSTQELIGKYNSAYKAQKDMTRGVRALALEEQKAIKALNDYAKANGHAAASEKAINRVHAERIRQEQLLTEKIRNHGKSHAELRQAQLATAQSNRQLKMQYDNVYAAQIRARTALSNLNRDFKKGVMTQQAYDRALTKINKTLAESTRMHKGLAGAVVGMLSGIKSRIKYAEIERKIVHALHFTWKAFFAIAAAQTLTRWSLGFARAGESVELMSKKLSYLTGEADALKIVSKSALKVGIDFETLNKTITRFAITTEGYSIGTMTKWTEALVKSGRAAGTTNQELQSGLLQLSQAMSAGRLMGDEFRSISENLPLLKLSIAEVFKEMGQGDAILKDLSKQGKITDKILIQAFTKLGEKVKSIPGTMLTIDAAISRLSSQAQLFVFQMTKGNNVVRDFIDTLANFVGSVRETLFGKLKDDATVFSKAGETANSVLEESTQKVEALNESMVKVSSTAKSLLTNVFGIKDSFASTNEQTKLLTFNMKLLSFAIATVTTALAGGLLVKLTRVIWAWSGLQKVLGVVGKAFGFIKAAIFGTGTAFAAAFPWVARFVSLLNPMTALIMGVVTATGYLVKELYDQKKAEHDAIVERERSIRGMKKSVKEVNELRAAYAGLTVEQTNNLRESLDIMVHKSRIAKDEKVTVRDLLYQEKRRALYNEKPKSFIKQIDGRIKVAKEEARIAKGALANFEEQLTELDKSIVAKSKSAATSIEALWDSLKDPGFESDYDEDSALGKLVSKLKEIDKLNAKLKESDGTIMAGGVDVSEMNRLGEIGMMRAKAIDNYKRVIAFEKVMEKNNKDTKKTYKELNKLKQIKIKLDKLDAAGVSKSSVQYQNLLKQRTKYIGLSKSDIDLKAKMAEQISSMAEQDKADIKRLEQKLKLLQETQPLFVEHTKTLIALAEAKKAGVISATQYTQELNEQRAIYDLNVKLKEFTDTNRIQGEEMRSLVFSYDKVQEAAYNYGTEIIRLDTLLKNNYISSQTHQAGLHKARVALVDAKAEAGDFGAVLLKNGNDFLDSFGKNFASMFKDVLDDNEDAFKNFTDRITEDFKQMLADMAYQALIKPIITTVQQTIMGTFVAGGSGSVAGSQVTSAQAAANPAQTAANAIQAGGSIVNTATSISNSASTITNATTLIKDFTSASGAFGAVGTGTIGSMITPTINSITSGLGIGNLAQTAGGTIANPISAMTGQGLLGSIGTAMPYIGAALAVASMLGVFDSDSDVTPDLELLAHNKGNRYGQGLTGYGSGAEGNGTYDPMGSVSGLFADLGFGTTHDAFSDAGSAKAFADNLEARYLGAEKLVIDALGEGTSQLIADSMDEFYDYAKIEEFGEQGGDAVDGALRNIFTRVFKTAGDIIPDKDFSIFSDLKGEIAAVVAVTLEYANASGSMRSAIDELVEKYEGSAEKIIELLANFEGANSVMTMLGGTLYSASLAGIEASNTFVKAAGGLEALASSAAFFFDNFFTIEEKMEHSQNMFGKSITDLNEKYGVNLNRNIYAYKDATQALLKNTQVSEALKAEYLALAPIVKTVIDAENELAKASEAAGKVLEDAAKYLDDFLSAMRAMLYKLDDTPQEIQLEETITRLTASLALMGIVVPNTRKEYADYIRELKLTDEKVLESKDSFIALGDAIYDLDELNKQLAENSKAFGQSLIDMYYMLGDETDLDNAQRRLQDINREFSELGYDMPMDVKGFQNYVNGLDETDTVLQENSDGLNKYADTLIEIRDIRKETAEDLLKIEIEEAEARVELAKKTQEEIDTFLSEIDDMFHALNKESELGTVVREISELYRAYGYAGSHATWTAKDIGKLSKALDWSDESVRDLLPDLKSLSSGLLTLDTIVEGLQATIDSTKDSLYGEDPALAALKAQKALIDANSESANAAYESDKKRYEDAVAANEKIREFLDSLKISELKNQSPLQQMNAAEELFDEAVKNGNADDATKYAQDYLQFAQKFYASTDSYSDIYNDVVAALESMIISPGSPGTDPSGSSSSIDSQISILEKQLALDEEKIQRADTANDLLKAIFEKSFATDVTTASILEKEGIDLTKLTTDLGMGVDGIFTKFAVLAGDYNLSSFKLADMLGKSHIETSALLNKIGISNEALVVWDRQVLQSNEENNRLNNEILANLTNYDSGMLDTMVNMALSSGKGVLEIGEDNGVDFQKLIDAFGGGTDFVNQLFTIAGEQLWSTNKLAEVVGVSNEDVVKYLNGIDVSNDSIAKWNQEVYHTNYDANNMLDGLMKEFINLTSKQTVALLSDMAVSSETDGTVISLAEENGVNLVELNDRLVQNGTDLGLELVTLAANQRWSTDRLSEVIGIKNADVVAYLKSIDFTDQQIADWNASTNKGVLDSSDDLVEINSAMQSIDSKTYDAATELGYGGQFSDNQLLQFIAADHYNVQIEMRDYLSTISSSLKYGEYSIADGMYALAHASGSLNSFLDVPGYETGTNFVPNDGLSYLHKGEMVIDSATSNQLRNYGINTDSSSDGSLIAELQALRAEVQELRAVSAYGFSGVIEQNQRVADTAEEANERERANS